MARASLSQPTTEPRFTLDGSAALEQHLGKVCRQVRRAVADLIPAPKLRGLLLAGGYGRGEGGVLHTPDGDRPYNDLEFYVFVRGIALLEERKHRQPLLDLGKQLSPEAGLTVEFKVLTLEKLRRSPVSMFYYDLVVGHRWLIGDDALLAGCSHHHDASLIPLHEATRLLLNRSSGLLFCSERLARPHFGESDAEFVGRNLAKARLAFGDVLLATQGLYHWSCRERHRRLQSLSLPDPDPNAFLLPALTQLHAQGVEFKLHPGRTQENRESLAARHAELVLQARRLWFWLENRRLHGTWQAPADYAFSETNLCPESPRWRNRLINARTFGMDHSLLNRTATRYPRERLMRSLALLLFEPAALQTPAHVAALQTWLHSSARDLPGLVAAYRRLWGRFN